jgi:hypothetical protein
MQFMQPFRSWRAGSRSALASFVLILFLCCAVGRPVLAQKGKGKSRVKKHESASPGTSPSPTEQSLTNIPLPVGHDAKGVILPDFDAEGHLRGKFLAANARRIDEGHIAFTDLKITTFTPEGENDLQVDLRTAVFDLKTKILSSKEQGTVKRADFNVIGDSLSFDTDKRTGHMVGHVKMVITSNSKLMEKQGEDKEPAPPTDKEKGQEKE